jgi:uncharacterized protein
MADSFAAQLADALEGSWPAIARPNQLPPPGNWQVWLLLAGRGFGKTRTLAEWVCHQAASGQAGRIALVAATAADARDVLVEGQSGILAVSPPWFRPAPLVDADPAERIKDMDHEGVDVNLTLPSGWFGTWTAGDDVTLEMAMYRAYHRWMADYCGAYQNRLGGVILAGARDIDAALAEIRRWGRASWAWGMMVYAPAGTPLDHPALEPLYAEAAELDLAVVLHTFTVMPPYAPGGQDTWDNLWLQRSAAHPWCGMRNMAAMIGSGVMDRYPTLRVGTLEAGHGWLPFWIARLDEHAETIKAALPKLGHKPSEYATGGRYFQSIEIPEGAKLTNAVTDLLGDHVLMYASDYPHGESHFPESVTLVLNWEMDAHTKRKLLWDNAVRFYARASV